MSNEHDLNSRRYLKDEKHNRNHNEENIQDGKKMEKRELEEMKKQKEKLKERQEEIEKIKDIVEKLQGKKYSLKDAFSSVKQMLGGLKENLTLQFDDDSKETVIKNMEADLRMCVDFLERRELSPAEVIENSTAVQGTFCTKNLKDWIEPRRQIVNIGSNVKLRTPTISQRDNIVEHSSQLCSNEFDKAVEKSGWGLAVELKGSYPKVGAGFKYEGEFDEERQSQNQRSSKTSYFCKSTYSLVPVALWTASLSELSLCEDVIRDLINVEHLITIQKKDLATECAKRIFQTYGSHFYCGSIHFGGVFQVKTEFQSEEESTRSSIEEIVNKTHSGCVNSCLNVFGIIQIDGGVSGHKQNSLGKIDENQTFNKLSKIHTYLTKLGGPIEINSLSLWKKGLVQNNSSWVVVDGGKPIITDDQLNPKDFVGLWNLLQNRSSRSRFKNSIDLSVFLLDTWHGISGLLIPESILKIDKIHWHKSRIDNFIEQSASGKLTSESCVGIFQKLSTFVQDCQAMIGQHSVWKETLETNSTLHSLLESLLLVQFKEIDAKETSYQVNKLITIANDVNFPKMAAVYDWLIEIKDPKTAMLFRDDKINNIESFFDEMRTVADKKTSDKNTLVLLTGKVATVITKLFEKFRTEDFLEFMVFVNFIVLLGYDVKGSHFRVQLTSDRLNMCFSKIDEIQENITEIQKSQRNRSKLQAVLWQNIIQSITSVTNSSEQSACSNTKILLIKSRFEEIREYILGHFSSSIDPFIQTAIEQNDLTGVFDTLKEIADGQGLIRKRQLEWTYFERSSTHFDVYKDKENLNKQGINTIETENKDKDFDRNMLDILKTFGLGKYFPEKISVQMVLSIHYNTSANPKETNIPWIILEKIISANSDFREKVLKDFWNSSVKSESNREDLFGNLSSSDGEDNILEGATYHPSDVFLAIFLCCDPFLKRLIVTKLSVCQFAVPILYSDYIKTDLVFSTWSINDIVLHGETETLISKKRHSLSFIRVGKGSVPSKSKLINEFLRDLNEEHATFIHKDCPLGMNRRTVSKGMIEVSWLVPDQQCSTNKHDTVAKWGTVITTPLNIFNLRGDAQEFEKQLNILMLLSNVMVILISYDDLQQENLRHVLQKLHSSNVSVLILTDIGGKEDKSFLKKYIEKMNIDKSKTMLISTMDQKKNVSIEETKLSTSDIKEKLTTSIIKLLEGTLEDVQIQNVKFNLPEGIRSDECPKCVIGKELAESLLKECMLEENPKNRRDKFLPLQGRSLWHEISKKEKDIKRTRSDVLDIEEKILKIVRQLRKRQTDICNEAPKAFSVFVEILLKHTDDDEVLQYYILWFKQMLNNQSRVMLKDLLQKFSTAFEKHESSKHCKEEDSNSKEELEQAEELLAEASFGIEHFFREVGQVYEAFMHTSEDLKGDVKYRTRNVLKQLPFVVAKLLLLGHSFEFMDGDAANVPQKWVTAVLKEVQNIVMPKKKVVTVSVLGIQSSRKSTLLNTMFGLEFSVSSGRCTKGIFIQVIPVKNLKNVHADYMIVLDTEGLRASERVGERVQHDNEIATLIVGLADVVLLNLKGESISDMSNILQIVITALLRLKQVNKNLTLRQSCIFIHQNVSKDAHLQLIQGNRNIVKHLDTLTEDVAIHENIANIKHFADVIKFNPTKDIKYMPDLFHGSPGMGPVSQKYSSEVTDVQQCILQEKTSDIQPLTFENYILHLQSLWQGIQAEDFIFSFRNIIEIKSYGILESEYQRIIWELEELKMDWMNNTIRQRLLSCQNEVSIAECARILSKECCEIMDVKYEESDKSLQNFVKTSELQEQMQHYIAEKCYNMKSKKIHLEQDILQSILHEKEKCIRRLYSEDLFSLKEKQIANAARDLARSFCGKKPTKEEMNNEFQQLWTHFSKELDNEIPQTKQEEKIKLMLFEIESTLKDLYKKHRGLLRKGMEEYPIDKGPFYISLMDVPSFEIERDDIKLHLFNKIKNIMYKEQNFIPQARNVVREIFLDIDNEFDNLFRTDTEYNQSQFSAIMKIIITKFISLKDSSHCFTLSPKIEIAVALRVARFSVYQFQNMNRNYEKKYGLEARLEATKPRVQQMFLNTCDNLAEEIIATKVLCEELKICIEEKLHRDMPIKMYREIVQKFNHQKHHLMKSIMEELARLNEFDRFIQYIRNPETYVKNWLIKVTDEEIFQRKDSECSSYSSWLDVTITDIIFEIRKLSKLTTDQSHSNMHDWIRCFRQQIYSSKLALIINHSSFQILSDHQIKNFQGFLSSIFEHLFALEIELIKTWKEKNARHFTWPDKNPYDLIYNFLWGCSGKCPWCHEPCQKSDPAHTSEKDCHTCIQHRPIAVSGASYTYTDTLAIESCHFHIQSNKTITCGTWCCCSSNACDVDHPFSKYKTYMKEWDIQPLADMSNSKYWNWFTYTFSEQLAEYYGRKQPEIPPSWKTLTKNDAIRSLSDVYIITNI